MTIEDFDIVIFDIQRKLMNYREDIAEKEISVAMTV